MCVILIRSNVIEMIVFTKKYSNGGINISYTKESIIVVIGWFLFPWNKATS
jgi:hypothetical protein